jgi:hypothetical protein
MSLPVGWGRVLWLKAWDWENIDSTVAGIQKQTYGIWFGEILMVLRNLSSITETNVL